MSIEALLNNLEELFSIKNMLREERIYRNSKPKKDLKKLISEVYKEAYRNGAEDLYRWNKFILTKPTEGGFCHFCHPKKRKGAKAQCSKRLI